jgi:beta-N-acetylhexosaminidase
MDDLRRRIGKAIVVGVRGADPGSAALREDLELCAQAGIGGVILFDRDLPGGGARNIESPAQVRELTRCLRETLGDGLLIMIDQEGGRVARLGARCGFDPGISAAGFAHLGESAQRSAAGEQAFQLASLGINVNLAPVVDLSISRDSAVITGLDRSFGSDADHVIACARVWIEAHRRAGVASCLKHFPGHGSASGDTHTGLVEITGRATRDRELAPFRALSGEPGVLMMTGHLLEGGIDDALPASLSGAHTDGVLRRELGFDGVVVTDSIDMGAITSRWSTGEAAALAFGAGADLVLDGVNAPGPKRRCPAALISGAIADAIESGLIADGERRLAESGSRLDRLLRSLTPG